MKSGANVTTLLSSPARVQSIRCSKRKFRPFSGPAQLVTERPQSRTSNEQRLLPSESLHALRLNNILYTSQVLEREDTLAQTESAGQSNKVETVSPPPGEHSGKRPSTSARRKRRYAQRSHPLPDKREGSQQSGAKASRHTATPSHQVLSLNDALTSPQQAQRTLSKKEEKALCLAIQVLVITLQLYCFCLQPAAHEHLEMAGRCVGCALFPVAAASSDTDAVYAMSCHFATTYAVVPA